MATRVERLGRSSTLVYRWIGACGLDGGVYEDVEADPHATGQAIATVVLSSLAAGIGGGGFYGLHVATVLGVTAVALLTWTAWAMLVFQIGTRALPEPQTRSNLGELLRTTGFAAAPGLLQVFAVLPWMLVPVFVGTWIWMIAAMVVGVRHALDYDSTWRAVVVCVVGVSLALALALAFGMVFTRRVS